jgi:hypothetical protein
MNWDVLLPNSLTNYCLNTRLDNLSDKTPKSGWWKRKMKELFAFSKKDTKPLVVISERERKVDISPTMTIQCASLSNASGSHTANGVAGILVTDGVPPYIVTWTPNHNGNLLKIDGCDGFIKIPELLPDTYVITVTDVNGSVSHCTVRIDVGANPPINCASLQDPVCAAFIIQNIQAAFPQTQSCKQWDGNDCSSDLDVSRGGRVGIGTSNIPSSFGLAVKGGIICDTRFRVELCNGWCDYVFEKNHKIMPLNELDAFIQTNKHLPGSITQAQVTQEEGFDVGFAKLDQQKKIEEAFLHLIALNDKVKDLQKRVKYSN